MMASLTSLYEEYEPKIKTFFETLFSEGGIQKIYDPIFEPAITAAFDPIVKWYWICSNRWCNNVDVSKSNR